MEDGRIIRILILAAAITALIYLLAGGYIFPAPGGEEDIKPSALSAVTDRIQGRLDTIAGTAGTASFRLSGVTGEGNAREVLESAFNSTPDAVCYLAFTSEGDISGIFPAPSDDGDAPQKGLINGAISSRAAAQEPLMTEAILYGDTPVFAIIQPVYDENKKYTGAVAAVIDSFGLLDGIVTPFEEASNTTFTVMQTNGLILYDLDTQQIGKNLFTDEIFDGFPNLRNLGVKFTANSEGYGSYTYYPTGDDGGRPVKKLAYWDSADLYGTQWRVIMFKEVLE